MSIIDPHHHLWNLQQVRYPWLEEEDKTNFFGDYSPLARNYLLDDYIADTRNQGLVKSVHLQAEADHNDPLAETRWLSDLAGQQDIPTAIVAYADLSDSNIESILEQQSEFERVRGIRQILNYHENPLLSFTDRNFLDDDGWRSNFGLLSRFNFSFDLQLYYQQMAQAARLATRYDDTLIILNHTGMPVERDKYAIEGWRTGMKALAACPNIKAKISGLGMTDPQWSIESIRPFVLETIDLFGVGRCMFASNFPVDSLFSSYDRLFEAFRTIVSDFSITEQNRLFHDNAERYYRL